MLSNPSLGTVNELVKIHQTDIFAEQLADIIAEQEQEPGKRALMGDESAHAKGTVRVV